MPLDIVFYIITVLIYIGSVTIISGVVDIQFDVFRTDFSLNKRGRLYSILKCELPPGGHRSRQWADPPLGGPAAHTLALICK